MTNGYHIEEHEENEKNEKIKDVLISKYIKNLYNNEVACEAYNKMLHSNIVFKRFLTEWTVTKHISTMEKEKIQETVLAFREEMKNRHTQIMSFIRSQVDVVSPKLTNMLLRVQTYAKKNVHLITMISAKFKKCKNFNVEE
jgi:hypothetical protein